MRVLFCGGGTGGHVTPALGMADILRQKYKNATFAFVGRSGGKENEAITREKYKLYTLEVTGLRRSLSPKNASAIIKTLRAVKQAVSIIREFSPDVIIGTGGYVCYPVLRAGIKKKIPTLIHESNAYPGLVTRLIGHKCDGVMLNYEAAEKRLPRVKKAVVCGSPVRTKLKSISREEARRSLGIRGSDFVILSFGGSLGATRINEAMTEVIRVYSSRRTGIVHIHATGRAEYERISRECPEPRGNCRLMAFIHDMPTYLNAADIAITRCGAMTLSEIAAVRLPAILIPSPNVTANHQLENARALCERNAALMIEESDLTAEALITRIDLLRKDASLRRSISRNLEKFDVDAGETITRIIEEAIRKKASVGQ